MQQEEIEHVEEVDDESGHIHGTTVCLDEATIIEQDEEEIEEELELEEEEEDDGVFTLELSEGSECEDKEYLGWFYQALWRCKIDGLCVNCVLQLNLLVPKHLVHIQDYLCAICAGKSSSIVNGYKPI